MLEFYIIYILYNFGGGSFYSRFLSIFCPLSLSVEGRGPGAAHVTRRTHDDHEARASVGLQTDLTSTYQSYLSYLPVLPTCPTYLSYLPTYHPIVI